MKRNDRKENRRREEAGFSRRGRGVQGIQGVRLNWSLKGHGYQSGYLPSAWVALYMVGGEEKKPRIHTSSVSVAAWRLRKGDPVGVSLDRKNEEADERRATRMEDVLPNTRPYRGVPLRSVDRGGNCTFLIQQPRHFPVLSEDYDLFLPLCSKSGLSVTVQTGGKTRGETIHMLSRLGLPFAA